MPAERIVGMRVDDSRQGAVRGDVPAELRSMLRGRRGELRRLVPTPAGRQCLSATYSPLRPDGKHVEAVLVISRDITQHMLAPTPWTGAGGTRARHSRHDPGEWPRRSPMKSTSRWRHRGRRQRLSQLVAAADPDLDMVRDALAAVVSDGHRAGDVIQRIRQLATKTDPQRARVAVTRHAICCRSCAPSCAAMRVVAAGPGAGLTACAR